MPIYLDCAATTPIEPRVREEVLRYLDEDFGNAGSRTHDYGLRARAAVEHARDQVAAVVQCSRGDVIFTSGATESNNLAILGLAPHAAAVARRHIVCSAIEHHAVLEPVAVLERRGFEVTRIAPDRRGRIAASDVVSALRPDTLLVTVMHVNNETGVVQPVDEVAGALGDADVLLHVDAAQGFGKELAALRHPRIDLVSVSGHKIHAPKGIGALIARRREGRRPPLEPLVHGGGQERGLRPGTLPVHLIAGFGKAAELALEEHAARSRACREFRRKLLQGLEPLQPIFNGDPDLAIPQIVSFSIPGLDAEAAIDAWQGIVAVAHGAACTSQSYTCSHVLSAMQLPVPQQDGALRLSWCHTTGMPDLSAMVEGIERVQASREGAHVREPRTALPWVPPSGGTTSGAVPDALPAKAGTHREDP
jgi:cysteine desulfurase